MNQFNPTFKRKKIFNRLLNYFLRGLLISIPVAATIAIIVWLFQTIDNILGEDHIPGLGILIIVSIILAIGWIGSSYIVQPILNWFDEWLEKTPGIKFLYSSVKDIMEAFVGEKKKFSEPVLVELAAEEVFKVGFITQKDLKSLGMEGFCAVYFPKSYGFVGDLYFVKNNKVKPLNANATEIFKMIVSGGVTGVGDSND
jgi:uncharacterized membrane protein